MYESAVKEPTWTKHKPYVPGRAVRGEWPGTFPESEANRKWKARVDDLLAIRTLANNWDGFGAQRLNPELVDDAIDLLRLLQDAIDFGPPSRVVPSPVGSVVIEWQLGQCYLEAELGEPGLIEWMWEQPGQRPQHWDERRIVPQSQEWEAFRLMSEHREVTRGFDFGYHYMK